MRVGEWVGVGGSVFFCFWNPLVICQKMSQGMITFDYLRELIINFHELSERNLIFYDY